MKKFVPKTKSEDSVTIPQSLTLEQAGCHIENLGDVLVKLDAHVTDDNNAIVIKPGQVPSLMVFLYDKLVETMKECEDKDLVLDFGDSALATTAESIVTTFIQLFRDPKLYD